MASRSSEIEGLSFRCQDPLELRHYFSDLDACQLNPEAYVLPKQLGEDLEEAFSFQFQLF